MNPRRWGCLIRIPYVFGQCWVEWTIANSYFFQLYIHSGEYFIALGRVRVVYTPPCWFQIDAHRRREERRQESSSSSKGL